MQPLSVTFKELFPGKPHWTAEDIPDLTGKVRPFFNFFNVQVVCVTGGNSGIGWETCKVSFLSNELTT